MNLTMIIPYYKPEITAIVHLMEDLAIDCSKYGAKVTIVTSYPLRGISKEVRNEYSRRNEEQLTDKIRILRVGSKKPEGKFLISRAVRYVFQAFQFYRKAMDISTDVFYIYSTPPVMGVIGALLSRKAPTLYCLQDIFPDNLLSQTDRVGGGSLICRILRHVEAYVYRKNDCIVTISDDMKRNLLNKGVEGEKISVFGNWVDTDEIRYIPRKDNHLFDLFNLDREGFYVSYSGNLGYMQDMDIVLESAKLAGRISPEIQFIIVGNGVYKNRISKRIQDESINNVLMLPMQPEEYTAMVYSLGDIGLVTLKKGVHDCAMPSKTWAMMAASQPILCTASENTQLYGIINETKAGIVIAPGDHRALAGYIVDLYNNREHLKAYGSNGRLYAEKNLSRESATMKYFKLLSGMACGGSCQYV